MSGTTSVAKFKADVGYNEIYPACDLALYRKTIEGGSEKFAELQRESKNNVKVVNGLYSLLLVINQ